MSAPSREAALAPGTLAVVATPLGHLGDLSPRVRDVLDEADLILAEDTRHSRPLLAHLGIHTPLTSLHEHNEGAMRARVLEALGAGRRLCLISDAGTPAISDPGALLVAAVHEAGHRVVPIPGPSALCAAISVAGMVAGDCGWLFVGFVARKGRARHDQLDQIARHHGGVVLFESPQRLVDTLEDLASMTPGRTGCLCRELTKRFEELVRAPLDALVDALRTRQVRGECTLVLGPLPKDAEDQLDDAELLAMAQALHAQGLSPRDIAHSLAVCRGVARKEAYRLAQTCKDGPI